MTGVSRVANTLRDMIHDALHGELDDFFTECEEAGLNAPNIEGIADAVCPVVKEFIDNQLQLD